MHVAFATDRWGRFTLALSAERDAIDLDLDIRDVPLGGGGGGGGGGQSFDIRSAAAEHAITRYGTAL
jgi:hypothetical protein